MINVGPSMLPKGNSEDIFRDLYDRRCRGVRLTCPVLIHLDDTSVIFCHEQKTDRAEIACKSDYLLLKDIAHLPLTVFLCCDQSLGTVAVRELKQLMESVGVLRESIEQSGLSHDAVEIQRELLDCLTQVPSSPDLNALARTVRHCLDFNVAYAAEIRLRGIHKQVSTWAAEVGREAWREARAVIATSPMARRDNLPYQYFTWLLQDNQRAPGECHVLKGEKLESEADAFRLLGMHVIDAKASQLFFGDRDRLHADVLAPAFPAILSTLQRPF